MAVLCTCGDRHRGRRRGWDAGDASHFDIAARVADVTLGQLKLDAVLFVAVLLAAAGSADHGRDRDAALGDDLGGVDGHRLGRCCPAGNLPLDAGECLEAEAAAVPLATRLPAAVERTKVGIDSSLVGFGTEAVGVAAGWLDEGTVLAVGAVSIGDDWECAINQRVLTFAVSSSDLAFPWPCHPQLQPRLIS